MNTKFIRAITLGVVTVVALSACSSGSGGSSSSGGKSITVAWESANRVGLEAVIDAFEKQNPGVSVQATYQDTDNHQAQTRTKLAAGTATDVFLTSPANGNTVAIEQLAPGGFLGDLSNQAWVSRLPASIKKSTEVNGKTQMLPMTIFAIGMLFNMDTMNKIGAKPPTSYSEVLQLCKTAQENDKIAFDIAVSQIMAIMVPYATVATNVYNTDPDFDSQQKAGQTTFSKSEGYRRSLQQEVDMNKAGCFGPRATGATLADSVQHVSDGSALGTISITGLLGQYIGAAGDAKLEYFPLPATDDPSKTRVSAGAGNGASLNAASKNKELAEKFIEWLGTPEMQQLYADKLGNIPAMPPESYQQPEITKNLLELFKDNKTGPLLDQNWPNARVQQTLVAGVQGMLGGQMTVDEVLASMDKAYAQK